jgi:hypothetical protein
MTKLEQLKFTIHKEARKHNCAIALVLPMNSIKQLNKEEAIELYQFAKERFVHIWTIDKDKVYKLNEKGELL